MSVLRRRSNGSVPTACGAAGAKLTCDCHARGAHERARVSLVRFIGREHELECLRSTQNAKIKNSRHQQERQVESGHVPHSSHFKTWMACQCVSCSHLHDELNNIEKHMFNDLLREKLGLQDHARIGIIQCISIRFVHT